jgi:hypothetical protein
MKNFKSILRHPIKGVLVVTLTLSIMVSLQNCKSHYVAQVPIETVQIRPAMPYANAVWIDKEWAWKEGRYSEVPGYYREPRLYRTHYVGQWENTPRGHRYVKGRWR